MELSASDLPAAFSVYAQMIRIAPADKVNNWTTENYNTVDRLSNIVWTSTPENPAISIVKFTLDEGQSKGDHNTAGDADAISADGLASGVKVGFHITNTGDVPLKNVTLADASVSGTKGSVDDIVCQVPLDSTQQAALGANGAAQTQAVPEAQVSATLKVGQSFDCVGTLHGLTAGQLHGDNATTTGESVYTGKKVQAQNPWYAQAPAAPAQPSTPKGAVTGIPMADSGNPWLISGGAGLLLLAAVIGTALGVRSRNSRKALAGTADS